jgi:hypothetical protein
LCLKYSAAGAFNSSTVAIAATVSTATESTTTAVVSATTSSAELQLLQDTTVKTATTKLKILFSSI